VIGMTCFGESAPAQDLYTHFGITTQRAVEAVRRLVHGTAYAEAARSAESVVLEGQ